MCSFKMKNILYTMARKTRKSTWIISALLIYNTAIAFYFLVYLDRENTNEEYLTILFSYVIVIALGFLLRRKETLQRRREDEINNKSEK